MMAVTLISVLSIIFAPFVIFVSCVILLASIGKTVGVRFLFVRVLLLIFEWGKQKIELHESSQGLNDELSGDANTGDLLRKKEDEGNEIRNRIANRRSLADLNEGFKLQDAMYFGKSGIQAIVDDAVTKRFDAAELSSWNLLTRTNNTHQFISKRLTFLWFTGFVLRYMILLPFRAVLALFAIGLLIVGTAVVGQIPNQKLRKWCYYRLSVTCYRVMARAFSAVVTFHNVENKAKGGGICVANHTSPIDIILLGTENTYAMVGQAQGGFMGTIQRAMSRAESHIWFQRSEIKDRMAVAGRLKEHVEDTSKLPILIFPEGTCINNTSIMMFKKGSFEVGGIIYPVAIKYDPRFADPFWNSSKQNLSQHLLMIITSWALVVDIWYMPPEVQRDDETAVEFANRIKAEIARQGGLVDLEWDGGLKRSKPKSSMMEKQQAEYSKRIKFQ